jgi:lipooligosaccharide transport system permease protein
VTSFAAVPFAMRIAPPVVLGGRRAARLVERNILSYRRMWPAFVTGVVEPMLFLFSMTVGLGDLIGDVRGPGSRPVDYTSFVAPGLLAASAMNGAIIDATFGLFYKLKFSKTFEAVLTTPLGINDIAYGEVSWSLIRGVVYSSLFLAVMAVQGTIESPLAVLALPACVLIALAFAALGMAGTTFMRGWQDFDFVSLALLPMFLFSATFYPLETYSRPLQIVVQLTPLFHGADLVRRLCLGTAGLESVVHVGYLVALSAVSLVVVRRRLGVLLLR